MHTVSLCSRWDDSSNGRARRNGSVGAKSRGRDSQRGCRRGRVDHWKGCAHGKNSCPPERQQGKPFPLSNRRNLVFRAKFFRSVWFPNSSFRLVPKLQFGNPSVANVFPSWSLGTRSRAAGMLVPTASTRPLYDNTTETTKSSILCSRRQGGNR